MPGEVSSSISNRLEERDEAVLHKAPLLSPKYKPYDVKEEILNKALKEMVLADRICSRKFSPEVRLKLKKYCFDINAGNRQSIKQNKDELRFQPQVALLTRK